MAVHPDRQRNAASVLTLPRGDHGDLGKPQIVAAAVSLRPIPTARPHAEFGLNHLQVPPSYKHHAGTYIASPKRPNAAVSSEPMMTTYACQTSRDGRRSRTCRSPYTSSWAGRGRRGASCDTSGRVCLWSECSCEGSKGIRAENVEREGGRRSRSSGKGKPAER